MIHCRQSRKVWRYTSCIMLTVSLMSTSDLNAFAETITNAGTNITTGRTADSYVEGRYGYVTLSGTVSEILDGDQFELDYGNGVTQVDYDDALHDLFQKNGHKIKTGDKVTVTGKIDNSWFTKHEILVSSIIHISDDYIILYKRPSAEAPAIAGAPLFLDGQVALTGIVSGVAYDGSLTLHYEGGTIQVDASGIKIPDNNRIVSGDVVTVYGKIDNSFFESRAITAGKIEKIGLYSRESPKSH